MQWIFLNKRFEGQYKHTQVALNLVQSHALVKQLYFIFILVN